MSMPRVVPDPVAPRTTPGGFPPPCREGHRHADPLVVPVRGPVPRAQGVGVVPATPWLEGGGEGMSESSTRSAAKDPDDWATGDEPPTGPQLSYLQTLGRDVGEQVPEGLSKADASKLIDEWQERSGRASGSAGDTGPGDGPTAGATG